MVASPVFNRITIAVIVTNMFSIAAETFYTLKSQNAAFFGTHLQPVYVLAKHRAALVCPCEMPCAVVLCLQADSTWCL